jgi:hypothetical protein
MLKRAQLLNALMAEWLSIKLTHSNFDIFRRSRVRIMVQSFISSINCVEYSIDPVNDVEFFRVNLQS